jgi:23S rRNA (cytosine1962-C5)-methyltransferase
MFVIITAYAIRASALSLYYALNEIMKGDSGLLEAGELVTAEHSAGRTLSMAIFARWGCG